VAVNIDLANSRTRGIMPSCPDVIVDEGDDNTRISGLVFHILHVTWVWKLETNGLPCYAVHSQSTTDTFILWSSSVLPVSIFWLVQNYTATGSQLILSDDRSDI